MSIVVSRPEGNFDPVPVGVNLAVLSHVYDLGWQIGYEGRPQHKVALLWEIAARKQDGSRFVISKTYTASLADRSNLLRDLESWRGAALTPEELKGFDLEKLRGAPAQLNLVEKAKTDGRKFADIAGVMRLARGMVPLEPELPEDYVPEWVEKALAAQVEPPATSEGGHPAPEAAPGDDFSDDIPF